MSPADEARAWIAFAAAALGGEIASYSTQESCEAAAYAAGERRLTIAQNAAHNAAIAADALLVQFRVRARAELFGAK